MSEFGIYRVEMDERWELKDLYEFPHNFLQVYSFAYCLDSELPVGDAERIDFALRSFPWRGGYSVVNLYQLLQRQAAYRQKPTVAEIKYASPGWLDIALNIAPALKVATYAASAIYTTERLARAYSSIQKHLQEISIQKRKNEIEDLQLSRQQLQEMRLLNEEISQCIGFTKLDELYSRTGSAEVVSKILSAQYRRLKVITDYVKKGKVRLPHAPK